MIRYPLNFCRGLWGVCLIFDFISAHQKIIVFQSGNKNMKYLLVATFAVFASSAAIASDLDWSLCEKEIKEFHCSGSDHDIWSCLEAHDDDLSASCQKTHEKADALFKDH